MTSDYFKLERMNQDSLYYRDGDYAVHRGIGYVIGEVEKRMNELYDENEHLIRKRGELETKNAILEGENETLKQALKKSYLNEICENCKYGHYFMSVNAEGFEGDFECTKKHFGEEHWKCDQLKECDDFEFECLEGLGNDS